MKLNSEFYRLPLKFDVDRLAEEVNAFDETDWIPHPTGYAGNTSIPLISVNGEVNNDFIGKMQVTPQLEKCPYIKQVIASFDEVFGRSRLMRLAGGCEVPEHTDLNYHWYNRVRIHIPVITYPDVIFYCGGAKVHMQPGEAWIFDSWQMHKVTNHNANARTHLVLDTSGSSRFWDMVGLSDQPHKNIFNESVTKRHVEYVENRKCSIQTEQYNASAVMSPGELDALCTDIISDARACNTISGDVISALVKTINDFRYDWRKTWLLYGSGEDGWPCFRRLVNAALDKASRLPGIPLSSNQADAAQVFHGRVLSACFNPSPDRSTVATPTYKPHRKVTASQKVGQNSPCPCGSGKKYKRCCGNNK